ncbi:stalk domain-containing protein [Cohnella lupini]|uniref:NHL repeat-containing protein n=1 Tax=Cohnella lupini TaxID=1294267 RepID=A0A3D9I383_9BACL|nr:stalk domain-containing protein [Cohnella lupini]RED56233.1 NHL repeat-containing protein [Cohnella lupini]
MITISRKLVLGLLTGILTTAVPTATLAASTDWTTSTKLYEVRTWAGKSEIGHGNGSLNEATFFHPKSAVATADGNLIVTDSSNHLIRKVLVDKVETFSGLNLGEDEANLPLGGFNDDVVASAAFDQPSGLAIDGQGNVYIADANNNSIRKISKDNKVTTLAGNGNLGSADGVGGKATFYSPSDVAVDAQGNVYVADTLNNVIRKITADGTVTTLTAPSTRVIEYFPGAVESTGDYLDGAIASAKFNEPSGLALDSKGNLYVSDRGNQRIRYLDFAAGTVSTVAGGGELAKQTPYVQGVYVDGTAAQSRLNAPEGLTVTADGSLIVADSLNHAIRVVKNGVVSTLAGAATEFGKTDGLVGSAQFNHPTDVTILADGRLVIVDEFGNKVRVLQKYAKPATLPTSVISVVYDGNLVPSDVPAQAKSNAVMLPVRSVGDALGYEVDFDNKTGNAILTKGETVYTIGKDVTTVTKTVAGKSETLTLNAATTVVNKRFFIPVRFFATESNLDIQWDSEAQIVVIRHLTF